MATYDERVNAIIEKAKNAKSPEEASALMAEAQQFNQQQQVAGGYNLLNTALLGLPDFLAKNITGEENYKKIQKEREELHPWTKGATDIAGTFAVPSGAILKGAGAMVKGLGSVAKMGKAAETAEKLNALQRAGKWLSAPSETVGKAILKGGLSGLEQTIPRIGIEAATKGELDPVKALTETGTSALVGGVAGGLLKGVGSLFSGKNPKKVSISNVAQEEADKALNASLAAKGVEPRVLRSTVNRYMVGRAAKKLEKLDELKKELHKKGAEWDMGKADSGERLDKWSKDLAERFKPVDEWFQKNPTKISNRVDDVLTREADATDPVALKIQSDDLASGGEVSQQMKKIAEVMDGLNTLDKKRGFLHAVIGRADGDPTKASELTAALNLRGLVDDELDDAMDAMGNEKFRDLLKEYKAHSIYAESELMKDIRDIGSGTGSATQAKLNFQDFASGKKGAGDFLAGAAGVLGPGAEKFVKTGINRVYANAAEPLQATADFVKKNKVLPKIGGAIEGISERSPGAIGQTGVNIVNSGAESLPVEAQEKAIAEEKATPEQKEQVKKQAYSQAYFDRLLPGLQELYMSTGAYEQGATWEEFIDKVEKKTDGFNPRKAAKLLYRDKTERKKFLRDLDRAEQLKGLDIDRALTRGNLVQEALGIAPGKSNRDDLVNTLASLTASNADLGDEKARENINRFISKIMELPAKKRKEALFNALTNKDIADIKTMKEWGLI